MGLPDRYYAAHKLRGTPPRAKTSRRLWWQLAQKMSTKGKRILLADGRYLHPTKGWRNG